MDGSELFHYSVRTNYNASGKVLFFIILIRLWAKFDIANCVVSTSKSNIVFEIWKFDINISINFTSTLKN